RRDAGRVLRDVVPDGAQGRVLAELAGPPERVEREVPGLVEHPLRAHPRARLVVAYLDHAVARPGDPVDDALHPVHARLVERKHDPPLESEGLPVVEGIVAQVVAAHAALAERAIRSERGALAHDPDTLRVVRIVPERVI